MSYVVRSNQKHPSRRGRPRGGEQYRRIRARPKAQVREIYNDLQPPLPCKVVVRNLPAHFTKKQFLQHVSPIPDYSYFAFHGPDTTLANHARCRVYIRFCKEDDVAVFKEKFDGYIFVDSRGHELRCIVEMAPYQRTAEQNKENNDPKCGKITETEEYKRFLEELEKKKEHAPLSTSVRVQANLAAIEKAKEDPGLTPLMEYIQNKFAEDDYRRGGRFKKERFRDRDRNKKGAPPGLVSAFGKKEPVSDRGGAPKGKGPPMLSKPFMVSGPKGMELMKPGSERSGSDGGINTPKKITDLGTAPVRPPAPATAAVPAKSDSITVLPSRRAGPEGAEFEPSAERGRHYFSERPKRNSDRPRRPDEDFSRQAAPDQRRNEPTDPYYRGEGYSNRGDYNSGRSANYGPPARTGPNPSGSMTQNSPKLLVNPITGSREFSLAKANTTIKPAESSVEVVEKIAVAKPPEKIPDEGAGQASGSADTGPRVPNRARPAKELYQPKPKRRYQN